MLGDGDIMVVCRSVVTVDYDMEYWDELVIEWIRKRGEKLGATAVHCRKSTNGGLHCVFCFPEELSEIQRLALEAALLDDPVRILMNLKRLIELGKLHDVLFEVKARRRRVI